MIISQVSWRWDSSSSSSILPFCLTKIKLTIISSPIIFISHGCTSGIVQFKWKGAMHMYCLRNASRCCWQLATNQCFSKTRPFSHFICLQGKLPGGERLPPISQNLLDMRTCVTIHWHFFEWKDDCELSKSNKKSKFGSLWIWTITILNMAKKDSPEATFPIAIGYSKDNHNNLECIIGNDIKRVSENRTLTFVGSRDGSMIEEVAFSVQIFLTIGNQPERRGGNSLLSGKSRSHRRWRYACNFSSLVSIVPTCKDCYALLLDCDSKSRSIAVQWKRECSVC
jgi:hypothetical protein